MVDVFDSEVWTSFFDNGASMLTGGQKKQNSKAIISLHNILIRNFNISEHIFPETFKIPFNFEVT